MKLILQFSTAMSMAFLAPTIVRAADAPPAAAHDLTLVDDGRSDYGISLPANAGDCERHAADELQKYLREITGAKLPIATASETQTAKKIIIARGAAGLGAEDYRIHNEGDDLVIEGGGPRGLLYGVYALLEERLGCHWLAPGVTVIPARKTLRLPPLSISGHPRFEYREAQGISGKDAEWAAHNRMNDGAPLTTAQGGSMSYVPGSQYHTMAALVPAATYFAGHPEYYALVKGKRQISQVCLTNPQARQIALDEVRRRLRQHPESDVISVSQNDGGGYCQCPACQALADREGTQAGPIVDFVNFVADGIRAEFPHKAVQTLAYYYSEKPPKSLKPLPNVIIQLCSYGCCSSHPLASCTEQGSRNFRSNLEGWNRLTQRIWLWDYTVNYAHFLQPFPNLRSIQPNAQYFATHGVSGVFEEGDYLNHGGELQELRLYLLAKLLWNPDCDLAAAREDFLTGYYGPAAADLRRYVELIHADPDAHVGLYDPPTASYLTPELRASANALFDHAELAVADRPELLVRVRAARLGVDYLTLATWQPEAAAALTRDDIAKVAARFVTNAAAAGVKSVHESPHLAPAAFAEKVLKRTAAGKK